MKATDLQKEITDYRLGLQPTQKCFSVKLIHLWYQRHRTLSISLIIIIISLFSTFITINNLKLEKLNAQETAERLKLNSENSSLKTISRNLTRAAPRFLKRAQTAFNSFNFQDAQNFCDRLWNSTQL